MSLRPETTARRVIGTGLTAFAVALASGCGVGTAEGQLPGSAAQGPTGPTSPDRPPKTVVDPTLLPGMPPPLDPEDVYAATRNGLAPAVRDYPELIYVPNGAANTVSVVDPKTAKVIGTYPAGKVPQHVVPSYDLRTLWVNSSGSNTLTKMDPATGKVIENPGRRPLQPLLHPRRQGRRRHGGAPSPHRLP